QGKYTGNVESAAIVGEIIADRCNEKGISQVAFDRSGYKYHGRVKALV
ncbi:50S ribosomal protein L18, partial [Francisella tularensis subsp. holarctica]